MRRDEPPRRQERKRRQRESQNEGRRDPSAFPSPPSFLILIFVFSSVLGVLAPWRFIHFPHRKVVPAVRRASVIRAVAAGLGLALVGGTPVRSDEGMWLLTDPPRQLLKEKYRFELTDDWLEHARLASVRFNSGGSGGFVSPDGLIVTNHHIGADSLQKL